MPAQVRRNGHLASARGAGGCAPVRARGPSSFLCRGTDLPAQSPTRANGESLCPACNSQGEEKRMSYGSEQILKCSTKPRHLQYCQGGTAKDPATGFRLSVAGYHMVKRETHVWTISEGHDTPRVEGTMYIYFTGKTGQLKMRLKLQLFSMMLFHYFNNHSLSAKHEGQY